MINSRAEVLTALGVDGSASAADLALANLVHPIAERALKRFLGFDVEQATYDEFYPDRGIFQPLDMLVEGYEGASGRAVPIERYRTDNRILMLRNLPVRSIQTVWEFPDAWNTFPPTWPAFAVLNQGFDYQMDFKEMASDGSGNGDYSWTGFLFRRSGVWMQFERSIRIQYTAGFTQAEMQTRWPEFKGAALTAAVMWFSMIRAQMKRPSGQAPGATVSESIDGFNAAYDAVSQQQNLGMFRTLPQTAAQMVEEWVRMDRYVG